MGMNYYLRAPVIPACKHCGRSSSAEPAKHIGKASAGWYFSFHAYPEEHLTTMWAWRAYIAARVAEGWAIEADGVVESPTEFWHWQDKRAAQTDLKNHALLYPKERVWADGNYAFCDYEFS